MLATKDEDAGGDKARQKNKIEKKNKEPPATQNVTQDPQGAGAGVATGVPKTSTKKAAGDKFVTGVAKSETDLNDPQDGAAVLATGKAKTTATKGVSATQGDKVGSIHFYFIFI